MLSSGIPLAEAIKVLQSESRNPVIQESLLEIVKDIEAGSSFSVAIERHPQLFNSVYVAVARSGEASGRLEEVLTQLADTIEKENMIVSRIRSAMIYPAFIILAMIAVAALMMVRVIPQLKSIFIESGAELPFSTRALISISDFMVNYWYAIIIVLVLAAIGLRIYLKTPTGILLINQLQARMPAGISEGLYMGRFARTMSMLIRAGIPIIQSLDISAQVMNNLIYADSLHTAKTQVERGIPLSAPLQSNRFFPRIVSEMILVGEQTGKLDEILTKLADYYDEEMDAKIRGISSLIEPVIIVILGIAVAFLVISILMPIYNIAQIQ